MMTWTKVRAVLVERNGRNEDILGSSNYWSLLIDVKDEGKDKS
jgi:hypothetical protein